MLFSMIRLFFSLFILFRVFFNSLMFLVFLSSLILTLEHTSSNISIHLSGLFLSYMYFLLFSIHLRLLNDLFSLMVYLVYHYFSPIIQAFSSYRSQHSSSYLNKTGQKAFALCSVPIVKSYSNLIVPAH